MHVRHYTDSVLQYSTLTVAPAAVYFVHTGCPILYALFYKLVQTRVLTVTVTVI